MTSSTIAAAIPVLEELVGVLDKSYWEANTLNTKDVIYDCISAINKELSELSKLSIQDHDYPYEMVTDGVRQVGSKLHSMQDMVQELVERTNTQLMLKKCLKKAVAIVDQQAGRWNQGT